MFLIVLMKRKSKALAAVCALLALSATAFSVCTLAGVGTEKSDDMVTSYVTVYKYKATEAKKSTRSTRPAENQKITLAEKTESDKTNTNISKQKIVYITKSGKKYHYSYTCGKGVYYECSVDEAVKNGLEPCKKCVK